MNKITWRKSSYSNQGGGCVEVADLGVGVRDSKDPSGPILYFTRDEWAAFQEGMLDGEFNHCLPAL